MPVEWNYTIPRDDFKIFPNTQGNPQPNSFSSSVGSLPNVMSTDPEGDTKRNGRSIAGGNGPFLMEAKSERNEKRYCKATCFRNAEVTVKNYSVV